MNAPYRSLQALFCLLVLLCACSKSNNDEPAGPVEVFETEPPIFKPVIQQVNPLIGGFYQALPARYQESKKNYPLLLFIHGGGQFGNGSYDLPLLLNEGIPQLLDDKKFPADFVVNGSHYSFIVLAPQFSRYPDYTDISSFLEHAKKTYRIDSSRIYITGFSLGARMTCDFSAEFASKLAAIVPISGVSNFQANDKSRKIAMANLPVWAFHNQPDVLFSAQDTKNFIADINSFNPVKPAKLTIFPDSTGMLGHDAWSRATLPSYKENNLNIYEWMLQHKR
jgi:predicted peptidase